MQNYDNAVILGEIRINESVIGTCDQEKVKQRAGQTVALLPKYSVNGKMDRVLVELIEEDTEHIIRFSVPKNCITLPRAVWSDFNYLVERHRQKKIRLM